MCLLITQHPHMLDWILLNVKKYGEYLNEAFKWLVGWKTIVLLTVDKMKNNYVIPGTCSNIWLRKFNFIFELKIYLDSRRTYNTYSNMIYITYLYHNYTTLSLFGLDSYLSRFTAKHSIAFYPQYINNSMAGGIKLKI